MQTLLVTGTDTGIGKTWISALLIRRMAAAGQRVGAYKPACSGAEISPQGEPYWHDIESLRDACGNSPKIDLICPQRFMAPLAPPLAATCEGKTIDEDLLKQGLERWKGQADTVVIEGAGGLLCPMSDRLTVADLAAFWKTPLIIVIPNKLGLVNHTLLTLEVARGRGLDVHSLVLNDFGVEDPSCRTNPELLLRWASEWPIFRCAYRGTSLTPLNSLAEKLI
jgi:dethiobiotin synthetase